MIGVLCVDDKWREEGLNILLIQPLKEYGIKIEFEEDPQKTLSIIRNNPDIKLVLLDLKLPDDPEQGKGILKEIKSTQPDLPVIILSGLQDVRIAEECCTELGASFYFAKGEFNPVQLAIGIRNAVRLVEKAKEAEYLRREWEEKKKFDVVVGESEALRKVKDRIRNLAQFPDETILLRGERGVGKDLVAEAIHQATEKRKTKPFIRVLCSGIPEEILESELFGVKPNFPGFHSKEGLRGKFREAEGGTIFLNEIGDMSLKLQAKILDAVDKKIIHPIGEKATKADVRIIAATNQPLEEKKIGGEFRGDLYDRLNVHTIYIPSLRERKDDIPDLVNHFIKKFNYEFNCTVKNIEEKTIQLLSDYDWPGNVRELENAMRSAFVSCYSRSANILTLVDFQEIKNRPQRPLTTPEQNLINDFYTRVYKREVALNNIPLNYQPEVVKKVLEREKGNVKETANKLRTTYGAIRRKMSKWGISGKNFKPKE